MIPTTTIERPASTGFALEDWLRWQESLNPRLVDLGLERPAQVAARMGIGALPMPVVTVAGTNGKGSCVAYLVAMLEKAGYPVAAYTSPFLQRYNESLTIGAREVSDETLIDAFERVEQARGDVALTFFEFRTLAVLDIIRRAPVALAVLEVGLGGRLDAVNLVDADVAVVTTVDLDHTDWLGPDRESIGGEKAGIFRARRPAVCGDACPPQSLVERARRLAAPLHTLGAEFSVVGDDYGWSWRGPGRRIDGLPEPRLGGTSQRANAAAAVMAMQLLGSRVAVGDAAVRDGIASAWLPGRQQILAGDVERIVDVAHNPEAARALAATLAARPRAPRTHALLAMLRDKDVEGVAAALGDAVDVWYTAALPGPRGQDGERVAAGLRRLFPARPVSVHADVAAAWKAARGAARSGERMVALGSFLTAREVLNLES